MLGHSQLCDHHAKLTQTIYNLHDCPGYIGIKPLHPLVQKGNSNNYYKNFWYSYLLSYHKANILKWINIAHSYIAVISNPTNYGYFCDNSYS